jgi:hypothetical protein
MPQQEYEAPQLERRGKDRSSLQLRANAWQGLAIR